MKVLIVSFIGTSTEAHYIYGLFKQMHNVEVTVLVPKFMQAYDINRIKRCSSIKKVINVDVPEKLIYFFIRYFNPLFHYYLRSIVKNEYDLIHFIFEFRLPISWVRHLLVRYPVVITIHEPRSTIHTLIRSLILNRLQEINCLWLSKAATRIIVHGEKHKNLLISKGISGGKIKVIPHGQFAFLNQTPSKILRVEEKNHILFFGKISPYKGLDYLIQAVKFLHKNIADIKLTIAGSGNFDSFYPLIRDIDYIHVDNRFIPDEEVGELFSRASIVVMPYTDGSQSGIISIAASFKKPVVATDVGNFSEMIINGKTGLLVPPRDPQALAEAMEKLLVNDKLRYEMGENAYKFMNENFSWEKIAQQTYQVYEEAIAAWKAQRNKKNRRSEGK
jgi:glycosyltransferase involved in cell wall biosynthesis